MFRPDVRPSPKLSYPRCRIRAHRDGECTLEEISEIIGLQVYTNNGVFLGNVNNLVVDVEIGAVDGLFVGETNPLLVEGGRAVSVPYRWIQSVGDIVILRYFPKRVSLKKAVAATVPEK
jgi:sporulation protein YlmC with PRC-barrel domain